jgi:hypothetical protein
MYTGRVVRLRFFAFIVAVSMATTPVLGVICEMDCEKLPAPPTCHVSANSPDGPSLRSGPHACNHDHSMDSAAVVASAVARNSVGTYVAVPIATTALAAVAVARVAILAMHGPPGLTGRSVSSRLTVLRI